MSDAAEQAALLRHCKWACTQSLCAPSSSLSAYSESMVRLNCQVPLSSWPVKIVDLLTGTSRLDNLDRLNLWLFMKGNFGAAMTDDELISDLRVLVAHKLRDKAAMRSMFRDLPAYTRQRSGQAKCYYNATDGDYYTISGKRAAYSTVATQRRRQINDRELALFASIN